MSDHTATFEVVDGARPRVSIGCHHDPADPSPSCLARLDDGTPDPDLIGVCAVAHWFEHGDPDDLLHGTWVLGPVPVDVEWLDGAPIVSPADSSEAAR